MRSHNKIDVSFTSYGNRIYFLPIMLFSIIGLKKYFKAIYLTIDSDERITFFKKLIFLIFEKIGVTIIYGESFGPHSKYLHYVSNYNKGEPFLLLDDDVFYSKKRIKELIKCGFSNYGNTSLRCSKVLINSKGKFESYIKWPIINQTMQNKFVFGTNVGGTFVSKSFSLLLKNEMYDFIKYASRADDVWFYYLACKYNLPYSSCNEFYNPLIIPFTQKKALWKTNVEGGMNDEQLNNLFNSI